MNVFNLPSLIEKKHNIENGEGHRYGNKKLFNFRC